MFGMHVKRSDARHIARIRTADERLRRHLYGETGATFSKGKYMTLGGHVMGTITTFATKDNMIAEICETL